MNFVYWRSQAKAHGSWPILKQLGHRATNRVIPHATFVCLFITLKDVNPQFLRVPVGLHARFLSAAELLQLPKQPDLCVSEGFLARALPKGDRCFALLESGRIASLGWYSRFPTRINEELAFSFDPACVYMYAGYTLPEYRGKRLHATGMALALAAYTAEGSKGIVSYVESWNVASLRSCERMGYKEIRRLRMAKLGSHYWIQNSRQCESLQVKLARVEKPPA